jgi:isoleucyl-tRNA synthetase
VDEWFISMDELRGLIADVNERITWVPEFGKQRELDWLRNMDDWMISKKRYWGLALPIYRCECGHFDVIGSKEELKARAVEGWDAFDGQSPHRPWIDRVKIECSECGARVSRITDVGNPWLDAGIVPFSTLDYRTKPDFWREWFPADWISESFPGQFRNWFYSLLTMSTVLENSEPFRTVFSYALMRDEKGEEMHKSKGNAIWFEEAAERMGVDSMRWLYARHNPAANLNFGYGTADEVRRRFIIPLWNVYSFFVTYANIDRYDPSATAPPPEERAELDRWILSELNSTVAEVTGALDGFEPDRATRSVEQFVEYLSNWYVRRSRRRFWKAGILGPEGSGGDADKLGAYATLYECLVTIVKLLAPFTPFIAESMYGNLVGSTGNGAESVHLDSYPEADTALIDNDLSEDTRLAMRLSSMGRAARSKAGIKVRQPLANALVKLRTSAESDRLVRVAHQLEDELNIRGVDALESEGDVLEYMVRPNTSLLGPKYGAEMGKIASALAAADVGEVSQRVNEGVAVEVGGYSLEPEEVLVTGSDRGGYSVASEGGYTVAVTTAITPELAAEGLARELVHRIQNMRRSAGFDIADHIVTYYRGDSELEVVLVSHDEYVRQETLSVRLVAGEPPSEAYSEPHKIDGLEMVLGVQRHQE